MSHLICISTLKLANLRPGLGLLKVGALGHNITKLLVWAQGYMAGVTLLASLLEIIKLLDPPLLLKLHFGLID